MKVPDHLMEEIEVEALKIRSKPFQDKEGFAFNCNRCMNVQPLVNQIGDFCVNCGAPVVRNFGSFDTLPLVEFVPEGNIPPAKAIELLRLDPPLEMSEPKAGGKRSNKRGVGADQWNENEEGTEQTMNFDTNDNLENDLFA